MPTKKSVHTKRLPAKRPKPPVKKMAGVTLHKADTSKIQPAMEKDLKAGKKHRVSTGSGHMPYDCPLYIEVERAMGPVHHKTAGDSKGLFGHVITLHPFTKRGVGTIQIKLYRDPNSLKITVAGEDVFKWTEDPNDLPMKFGEAARRDGEIGGAWAEHLDLEPGDVVEEADDGTMAIKRAPRARGKKRTSTKEVSREDIQEDDIVWE